VDEALRQHGDVCLSAVDAGAVQRFLEALRTASVPHVVRRHEPARHARHLAAIWQVPLPHAGRATLFSADGTPVLAVVPADRKVSAPRFSAILGASVLRVLRADRGVGRLGWHGLPQPAGALCAVPGVYGARLYVEEQVLASSDLVVALDSGRSVCLRPKSYAAVGGATVARFAGTTRLLPEGGMIDEASSRSGAAAPERRTRLRTPS
jgi:prolyl-tRNA editing enzyme YbaK/EbsC (Cys-tRNA(Pro) deacylase)